MPTQKRELRPTPKQVPGPFFVPNATVRTSLIPRGMKGDPVRISGQVLGTDGKAIANATVHIWVADPNGRYDNQDDHGNPIAGLPVASLGLRARIITDARGRYSFKCLRPGNYPLDPQGKDLRPSHIHARVDAPGYKTLVTQLYFIDDGWNEHDLPGEDFFQPELVVHTTPALPEPGVTLQGVFNFVIEPK